MGRMNSDFNDLWRAFNNAGVRQIAPARFAAIGTVLRRGQIGKAVGLIGKMELRHGSTSH
jgi:hypothetical protein